MKKFNKIIISIFVMALVLTGLAGSTGAYAAVSVNGVDTIYYDDSQLEYLFTIDGRDITRSDKYSYTMTVQNFSRFTAGGSTYYFISQHSGANTYISRCILNNKRLSVLDYIRLDNYGHGESLEVTGYDANTNTYTMWIGATAGATSNHWSTDVARIKYRVSSSGASLAESKIITGLESASGSSLKSSRSSVSVAENSSRICISTQLGSGTGAVYFYVYGLEALSSKLDLNSSSKMTLESLGLTPISKFSINNSDKPHGSFQGQDIRGKLADNKFLFISGGKNSDDAMIYQFYYTNSGSVSKEHEYVFKTKEAPVNHNLYKAEIEGIKIYKDGTNEYIYVSFFRYEPDTTNAKDKKHIIDVYRYPLKLTQK